MKLDQVNLGHGVLNITVLDAISIDHLFENMVQAAIYSVSIGEDQLISPEPEVLDFLLGEDLII